MWTALLKCDSVIEHMPIAWDQKRLDMVMWHMHRQIILYGFSVGVSVLTVFSVVFTSILKKIGIVQKL